MLPLPGRSSRLGLIVALCLPLAPRAGAEDKEKAPPRALDVLRAGAFGGRESEAVVGGSGPSGGRAAARPALATKTSERGAPKTAVPPPAVDGGGSSDTILGVNKTVLAGGAALGGVVLIGLSGGAIIPIVLGGALLIGGGAYLVGQASHLAKSITNPLNGLPGR